MQAWVQISNRMETISLVVRLGGLNEANPYLLWISTLVLSQVVQAGKFASNFMLNKTWCVKTLTPN
jgi:hypothetical protein